MKLINKKKKNIYLCKNNINNYIVYNDKCLVLYNKRFFF
jgi:hypothetical protein